MKEAELMKEDVVAGKESQLEFWTELEATQGHLSCAIEDSFHLRHSLESIQEQLNQTADNQVTAYIITLQISQISAIIDKRKPKNLEVHRRSVKVGASIL